MFSCFTLHSPSIIVGRRRAVFLKRNGILFYFVILQPRLTAQHSCCTLHSPSIIVGRRRASRTGDFNRYAILIRTNPTRVCALFFFLSRSSVFNDLILFRVKLRRTRVYVHEKSRLKAARVAQHFCRLPVPPCEAFKRTHIRVREYMRGAKACQTLPWTTSG